MPWDKFIFVSDNHGDQQSPKAVSALKRFMVDWNPVIRIHGGDNWDFRPLRKKADEEERREHIKHDFAAGMRFLKEFTPTHFLRGNHDERLWDLRAKNNGLLSEYAEELIERIDGYLGSVNCKMLPYDRRLGVLELGKLRAIHGYTAGVNAARRSALAYGSVLQGHAHSIQSASIEGLDNRVGHIVGCLCNLDMEYSRATMASLVHRHGFRYGVIDRKSGEYFSWQAESIAGKWMFPSDIKEIR